MSINCGRYKYEWKIKKRYDLIDYGVLGAVIEYYEKTASCVKTSHHRHLNSSSDEMSLQRLGRALSNVSNDDAPATYSRFAIWGADLNCVVEKAMTAVSNSDTETALKMLEILQRNARAFVDCCSLIDSQPGHMGFENPAKILNHFKNLMEEYEENSKPEFSYLYSRFSQSIEELESNEVFKR